ncbi:hypothetical protein [Actinomadura formosensis]|uniref:hypothetical protein n=1 Tax=Actinomadura formosensis TaxID=60706 RepID=UPI003D9469CE
MFITPDAPPALPLPTYSGPWRARWHLTRLALAVRRNGWTTQLRTIGRRHVLRVFAKAAPTIRESVTVAWGNGAWWYQSTTGLWLAPCNRTDLAADKLNILLTPWISAAFDAMRDEKS